MNSDFNSMINNFMDSEVGDLSTQLAEKDPIAIAIVVVCAAIIVVSIIAIVVTIYLAIRYVKYNRKENSVRLTGELIARKILDANGLSNIAVSCSGSILFGNSYSHYFKKVRLRRLTWRKASVSALAMASQKSALAVLDKEKDPDMKRRIRITPIISFGPFLFIPIIIVGLILDRIITNTTGVISVVCVIVGLVLYIWAFVLSLSVLKTEKKAQDRAIKILSNNGMATEQEIKYLKKLFKLYNIEYVNNMILALLEIIYNVLRIVQMARGNGGGAKTS